MTIAVQLQAEGSTDLIDLQEEVLGSGELRVAVTLAGVNFWEIMQRRGRVPLADPRVPGTEGVGLVVEVGSTDLDHLVGTRVAWSKVPRSYAGTVAGPARLFYPVPDELEDEAAAGLLFQGATAHYLAADTWPLVAGDSAIVTAAAGGVGLLLVQLLAARGVRVLALTSSSAKTSEVEAAGAAAVFHYDGGVDAVRAAAPSGVEAVFDSVGGDVPRMLLPALRPRGAMVLYGAASGAESDLGPRDLGAGSYFLTRTAGRDYARTPEESAGRARALLELAARGDLRVHVGGVWSLAEASVAWDTMESRSTAGKLLLKP